MLRPLLFFATLGTWLLVALLALVVSSPIQAQAFRGAGVAASQTGTAATHTPSTTPRPQPTDTGPPGPAVSPQPQVTAATGSPVRPIEGGQIVARVGGEIVLAADVLVGWHDFLVQNADRIQESEREKLREMFMQRQLDQLIDTKLLYAAARRAIPAENFPKIEKTLGKKFEETRIPQLLKTTKTNTRAELDARLHEMGTSLARRKKAFVETVLAQEWLRGKVAVHKEINFDELWDYYQQHQTDFDQQAKARWEEIEARFDRFPSKDAARKAIAQWGNLVWYRRVPFAKVARKYSQGVTADDGGRFDWTTQGSLRSDVIDRAIFSLPVGQLSQILEDEKGLHIVRVIERKPAGRTPFEQAQPEIRQRIKKHREKTEIEAYLAHLRKITPLWTRFGQHSPSEVEQAGLARRANP